MLTSTDISKEFSEYIWNIVQVSTSGSSAHGYLESVCLDTALTATFTFTNGRTVSVPSGGHYMITTMVKA